MQIARHQFDHIVVHVRVDGWNLVYPTSSMIIDAENPADARMITLIYQAAAEMVADIAKQGWTRGFYLGHQPNDGEGFRIYAACAKTLADCVAGAAPWSAEAFAEGDRCCGWASPKAERVNVAPEPQASDMADPTTIQLADGVNVIPFAPGKNGGWDA